MEMVLKTLQERSAIINHRHRITGDAVTWIIEEVIAMKSKIKIDGLQDAIEAFIDSQVLIPGKWRSKLRIRNTGLCVKPSGSFSMPFETLRSSK